LLPSRFLRGRKTVRADRRLRTDEKHIRAQSTILYKSYPKSPLLLSLARPLAATKAKMSLSLEASNGASFRLPVDNIRADVAIVEG